MDFLLQINWRGEKRGGGGGDGSLRVKMRPPTTKKSCRGANVEVETHKENWHLRKLET